MFQARRGKHAVHAETHPRPTGSRAAPHHRGGSLRVADSSPDHPNGVWYHDPYDRPEQPHHIHRLPCEQDCSEEHEHVGSCADHRVESCPDGHWIGGHPDPEWPHHVEYDGSTGLWGYTRLTDEECADRAICEEYEREVLERIEARVAAARTAREKLIHQKAKTDPAFRALAEHLGVHIED